MTGWRQVFFPACACVISHRVEDRGSIQREGRLSGWPKFVRSFSRPLSLWAKGSEYLTTLKGDNTTTHLSTCVTLPCLAACRSLLTQLISKGPLFTSPFISPLEVEGGGDQFLRFDIGRYTIPPSSVYKSYTLFLILHF